MSAKMSVTEMLETLRGQIDFHRSREAFHAQQEIHHREERERHAGELEVVSQRFAALESAAAAAQEVLRAPEPPAAPAAPDDSDLGPLPKLSQAFARVLAGWPPGASFGATAFVHETRRRFRQVRGDIDNRSASLYLRRRREDGSLEAVREGRAYHEALYRKPER